MFIALDFDGVCVTDDYPHVGRDIGAAPVLLELVARGHKLILYTIRSGRELEDAEQWFRAYGIPLYGVNKNPVQWRFSRSPKLYCHLYIDDHGLGCPMKSDPELSDKPFLDWERARQLVMKLPRRAV